MAIPAGVFDPAALPEGWFDDAATPAAMFDRDLVGMSGSMYYAAVAWVQIEVPKAAVSLTPRRALYLAAGALGEIPTALLGTGKKPIVILSGELKERAASEGIPVILDAGVLRCLNAASESLEV